MTETARRKFQQHVDSQRVKQRAQHEDNTVKGVQTFIKNKIHCEEIDYDQSCVVDGEVSANRMQILFTSLNMMINLIEKEGLVLYSDDADKIDLN